MKRGLSILCMSVVLLALFVPPASAEPALLPGGGFDQALFFDCGPVDNVADQAAPCASVRLLPTPYQIQMESGFSCPSNCRYWVENGSQYLRIQVQGTSGAKGDLRIVRKFDYVANPAGLPQEYNAAATVLMQEVQGGSHFWAKIIVVGVNSANAQITPECAFVHQAAHLSRSDPGGQNVPIELALAEPCVIPPTASGQTVTGVNVKIGAHTDSTSGSGTLIVKELSFRRTV